MILLLLSVALAQEPQVFDPLPADVKIGTRTYSGILVDEATFTELGSLRVDVKAKEQEILAFEEWKKERDELFTVSLSTMKVTCEEGNKAILAHYDTALLAADERVKDAGKRTFLEKHGFEMGVALGVVGATVLYLGSSYFYGQVLEVSLQ